MLTARQCGQGWRGVECIECIGKLGKPSLRGSLSPSTTLPPVATATLSFLQVTRHALNAMTLCGLYFDSTFQVVGDVFELWNVEFVVTTFALQTFERPIVLRHSVRLVQ